jgi:hypothetical protein
MRMKNEKHAMKNEKREARWFPSSFCIFHCMFFIFHSTPA